MLVILHFGEDHTWAIAPSPNTTNPPCLMASEAFEAYMSKGQEVWGVGKIFKGGGHDFRLLGGGGAKPQPGGDGGRGATSPSPTTIGAGRNRSAPARLVSSASFPVGQRETTAPRSLLTSLSKSPRARRRRRRDSRRLQRHQFA